MLRSDSNYSSRAANYLDQQYSGHDSVVFENNSSSARTQHTFPSSIGEYGMGRLLGRGAFGSVYEVTEIRHKTPLNDFKYAIKIVNEDIITVLQNFYIYAHW